MIRQIEIDADQEILRLKLRFEKQLKEERETTLRLKVGSLEFSNLRRWQRQDLTTARVGGQWRSGEEAEEFATGY